MKFIQVTDPHLVPRGERLFALDPVARLEACVADIGRVHGDAAFCVVTGDLADRGEVAAYRAFRESFAALAMPCVYLMGNHDDRANFLSVFPEAALDENGYVQSVIDRDEGVFLFLDTLEAGVVGGVYCARRLAWLRARLDEAAGRPVHLFMHHPPFDIGMPALDRIRLQDPEAFHEVLAAQGDIRHLFFGHVHRPVTGSWRGIAFSTLRGTAHGVPLDLDEPTRVHKSHEPPAYAVVFVEPDRVVVHFHDFLDRTKLVERDGRFVYADEAAALGD